jgi:hypothetical protein
LVCLLIWAGKNVAFSESAGKFLLPHGLQQAYLKKGSGTQN